MAAALIVVSALCTIFLACFLPVKRVYSDVPSLALVLWLLVANLIHTVNTAVWAGNIEVHSEIWCDIATKLVLGVNVAVPAAFLCIGRQLELLSSSRKIFNEPRVKRNSMMFEILCCYVIPLIYMSLHVISQHHRFDLVEDFGCSASIHPSTPALIIIWALPLLLSAIALFICGFAIHHSLKMNTSSFAVHLSNRTEMPYGVFFRRLATAMAVTGISAVTILFSLFSIPVLKTWTTWEEVHSKLSEVNIVSRPQEIAPIRLNWWTLFIVSAVYILLSIVIGEETRDSYRWLVNQSVKCHQLLQKVLQKVKSKSFSIRRAPRSLILPMSQVSSPVRPHTVELKSGWDDMLDFKYPNSPSSSKRSKSPLASPASSRSPSATAVRREPVTPTKTTHMSAEDTAFMNSTISYLGSPPAKSLGVSSPTSDSSPPRFHLPRRPPPALALTIADPVLPASDAPLMKSPAVKTPSIRSPTAVKPGPQIASVFEAEWPIPPNTPSPVCSRYDTRSPTQSVSDSVCSDVPSYYRGGRPFEGSSIPTSSSHGHDGHPSLKRSLSQGLRVSWDRVRHGSSPSFSGPDGIRMTVVQETV